jgi:hypothetical protein
LELKQFAPQQPGCFEDSELRVFKPKLCCTSFDRFGAKIFQPAHDRLENLSRREPDSKYNLAKQLRANSLRAVIFSSPRRGLLRFQANRLALIAASLALAPLQKAGRGLFC